MASVAGLCDEYNRPLGCKVHPVSPSASLRVAATGHARVLKAKVLRGVLGAMHGTGLLNKYVSRRLHSKALVLMYHRVLEPEAVRSSLSQPGIIVSTLTFEKHVRYLLENFKVLSIEEFLEHIRSQSPFEDRSCLITFDDGWRDNYTCAFPILKKYNAPAVIFLATGFIGADRSFWQERLVGILTKIDSPATVDYKAIPSEFPEMREELNRLFLAGRRLKPEEIAPVSARMKNLPHARIENLLARLNEISDTTPASAADGREFMSWDEIREMAADGIGFGSHGVNHTILTIDGDSAVAEVAASKTEIENRLGQSVSAFSYPNGNHSERVVKLVKESGYQSAFGTSFGYATHSSDPFRVQRVNVHESASNRLPIFLGRIAGLC